MTARNTLVLAIVLASGLLQGCGATHNARDKSAVDGKEVRFRALVWELALDSQAVSSLNSATLARTEDLEGALAQIGDARILYTVDHSVNLVNDRIEIGARAPVVANTRRTEAGAQLNTVRFEDVGARFQIKSKVGRTPGVSVEIELALMSDSPTVIAQDVPAPMMRTVRMTMNGPVRLGEPHVLISTDNAADGADTRATAWIVHMLFTTH